MPISYLLIHYSPRQVRPVGQAGPKGSAFLLCGVALRVACYIDGFNLYHAIADLRRPHLKWVNLWALAESLCRGGEILEKVAYFSAYATWMPGPYARHREYVAALKSVGVECHIARFSEQTARCKACGTTWREHEEKETDVHFSLTFLEDAVDNVFDRAIII